MKILASVVTIQSTWRAFYERQKYQSFKNGIVQMQSMIRRKIQQNLYLQQKNAAETIQLHTRAWLLKKHDRMQYLKTIEGVCKIQSLIRMWLVMRKIQKVYTYFLCYAYINNLSYHFACLPTH